MPQIRAAKSIIAGGRSLSAVWQSTLTATEKLVLLYVASEMCFVDLEAMMRPRWIPVSRITAATSLSRTTVFTVIRRLEHAGYLCRGQRYQANMQLPNYYALTPRIFEEYACGARDRHLGARSLGTEGAAPNDPNSTEAEPIRPPARPELVYEPDMELLQEAPSLLPKVSSTRQRQVEREAYAIGALIYMPTGAGRRPYVDREALRARMLDALAEFGIEVLRTFKARVEAEGALGNVVWDPHRLLAYCREIRNEVQSGEAQPEPGPDDVTCAHTAQADCSP